MAGLLNSAQNTLMGLLNTPTKVQQFLTNPQAFLGLLGQNRLPNATGFAAGATGLPMQTGSVLDPNQVAYERGYSSGEPVGYAAMASPMLVPAARALAPKAGQMAENYMMQQGMMPNIVPDSKQIKNTAEEFAKKIKELGFEADVKHSGSKAGASSYVSVSDPTTGRFVVDPYRFSGHSKGPYQSQFVNEVSDLEKQFPYIEKTLMEMREKGPASGLQKQQFIEQKAEELIKDGVKPKTAYKQAIEMAEKNSQEVKSLLD